MTPSEPEPIPHANRKCEERYEAGEIHDLAQALEFDVPSGKCPKRDGQEAGVIVVQSSLRDLVIVFRGDEGMGGAFRSNDGLEVDGEKVSGGMRCVLPMAARIGDERRWTGELTFPEFIVVVQIAVQTKRLAPPVGEPPPRG